MRTLAGVAVIWAVFAAAYLSCAVAGVIGSALAGWAAALAPGGGVPQGRWVGQAMFLGVTAGWAGALVVLLLAPAVGWSLAGFTLPPLCWSIAAVAAAFGRLATRRRSGAGAPQGG